MQFVDATFIKLFEADYIKYTPSRRDDISKEEEDYKRSKGVRFIIDVSQHLQLPQIAIATAATFLHRFYMRKSFKEFHHYDIGGTCVFMACKTEEVSRKMKEVAIACAKSARKDKHLKDEKEFDKWHHTITKREPTIAATLCFDLSVEHPYKPLVEFFRGSKGSKVGYEGEDLENLFGSAWAFINDSFLTTTPVLYKPNVIASAVIFIASKLWGVQLNVEEKWWKKTKSSVYDIAEAVDDILEIYKLCKPRVVKKKEIVENPDDSGNPLENTEIENTVTVSHNSEISNSEIQTPKIESPDIKVEQSNQDQPMDDELEDGQITDDEKTKEAEETGQEVNGDVEMDLEANNDNKV
ncbi:11324_t:CDS:2 [Acaulospora morrowiae]|uniref:11324_t:CDS:1 n=1 Tax=Acaulospora morrowiae TaxID=94023 RepID=A0A9N9A6B2_9GLOM|nr:11324_t:CDS:2 [Acaulospora morrowiae]